MQTELTISKTPANELALDQRQLYALGLQHIVDSSSHWWNDYNVHDPGVTTLEILCYALTDLANRAMLPVEDLLATSVDNAENMAEQFPTAQSILTNRPVTDADFRRLLIDVTDVKNAWLEPAKLEYFADTINRVLHEHDAAKPNSLPVQIEGLYDVLLEFDSNVVEDSHKAEIIQTVRRKLHNNRNLCEDFVSVDIVPQQAFILCGEFELAPEADVSRVSAEILFQVQQYLAPSIPRLTLPQILERKHADGTPYNSDDIFNGPILKNGFITDEDLQAAELRRQIRLSDVINIIMDIEGVRIVRDLVINPAGTTVALSDKWIVAVDNGHQPVLDNSSSRMVFYKRKLPVVATPSLVDSHLEELANDASSAIPADAQINFPIPLGRFLPLETYYSIQNHFPEVYGIGEFGLSPTANDARHASANQLKAYLLFFDQILANYASQLSHVRDLYSKDPSQLSTYFHQKVEFTRASEIYGVADPVSQFAEFDSEEQTFDRRHRFLDHLVARYAEGFSEIARIMSTTFGFSDASMVRLKCDFLNNYASIGSERGLAYNYTLNSAADIWDSANVSGLEKRLSYLLGMPNFKRRDLSTNVELGVIEFPEPTSGNFEYIIKHASTAAEFMRSPTGMVFPQPDATERAQEALDAATLPSSYRTVLRGTQHAFEVVSQGNVVAVSSNAFGTEAELLTHIDEVVEYLRTNVSNEGMYVIEAILLRPEAPGDPLLPIAPDPTATAPENLDPYSYRLHIFLPAFGSRFKDMEFRRFAEEIIRDETPAHILPRICWISQEDMQVLEKRYHAWIQLKSGSDTSNRTAKLNALIEILFKAKNVYPTQNLHGCADETKFQLGQSSLGTLDLDHGGNHEHET